ncbi:hypothetical protein TTHT_0852 [Thermotomaculum hydrothermale]|uniref:Phosphate acetyl/butaryl transferase domain-containing protein n=1 Tax=Thermotomaculum hydrothermale TaxID=981385 RepID=A0A7R6SY56_9BACT|nr:phosphate acyltransferase [Thermotomaculum hydrothermale]BBB32414.1 hypothetical protein TTHT_0852 [Thermotomaculum hydrothermale]
MNSIREFFENFYSGIEKNRELKIDFSLEIANLFKELSKEYKKTFSTVAKIEIDGKTFFVSDPYINIQPSLKQFPKLVSNTIAVAKFSGIEEVKVAVVSAVELVNLNMESSVYGAVVEAMGKRGQFGKGVFVEGPLSMDVALSEKAAKEKKVLTDVAGKANALVCHRGSIARGIVDGLDFSGKAKTEIFLTDGEEVFKVV